MSANAVVVFESASAAPCAERALVLRSQGIASEAVYLDGRHVLLVSEESVHLARDELAAYQLENAAWPARDVVVKHDYLSAWPGVVGYVAVVCLLPLLSGAQTLGVDLFNLGRVDAALIRTGEWWRAATALTLHLDIAHLASNLVFGTAFGYFAGRYFGYGIAWLGIVLAGTTGNMLNSFLLSPAHTSVGASTAIFGALGMIAAFAWKRKLYPQDRWAYRLGPIVAGIAVLAYTGTGGERTDVSAHLTGFASGFSIGIGLALTLHLLPRGRNAQRVAAGMALAVLGVGWLFAISPTP